MTSAQPQTLRVADGLHTALSIEALRTLESEALKRFLAERRWFGAKGRDPRTAEIRDVIPLPWPELHAAIARLEVDLGDGRLESYQLPLVVRDMSGLGTRDSGLGPTAPESRALLAYVEADGGERGVIFDAVQDADFRSRLGEALAAGTAFEAAGAHWSIELMVPGGAGIETEAATRVIAAEQSNTSIVFGDRAILKLFRRLEPGEHPEAEVARFLATRTPFRNTPELLGTIHFRDAAGHESTAGMLQRFLPNVINAWSHALSRMCDYLGAWEGDEPPNLFVDDAAELGRVTRALHEALASDPSHPEFSPRPAGAHEVALWAAATRRAVERGLALLESRGGGVGARRVPAEGGRRADGQRGEEGGEGSGGQARALIERRDEFLARIRDITAALGDDAGQRIRHHGDYHLGQVLRTPAGEYFVIDFEGEPARPLAERRERHSALRDVAGMLRSFAYVAATGAMETDRTVSRSAVEERATLWERDARNAFLRGYMPEAQAVTASFLPRGQEDVRRLLALFEIEKVFYELAYELNNRPDWAWIPVRGIARLIDAET